MPDKNLAPNSSFFYFNTHLIYVILFFIFPYLLLGLKNSSIFIICSVVFFIGFYIGFKFIKKTLILFGRAAIVNSANSFLSKIILIAIFIYLCSKALSGGIYTGDGLREKGAFLYLIESSLLFSVCFLSYIEYG